MQAANVIYLSSYELIMSFIFMMVTIVLATKFMNKFVLSSPVETFIKRRHKSGCLMSATLIFSVIYLVQGSIEQSTLALQSLVISHNGFTTKIIAIALAYFTVFYLITFIASVLIIFVVSLIYRKIMSEVDFDDEIEQHDNFGLSLFLSFILINVVIFMDKPLSHFLGSLVFHDYLGKL
ncbi:MAG: hypothetical protein HN509_09525 [Halobacteriovoraceae bacterium]|jgi:hypothetical protein|nr:hypothetical protein [Halobacteriovoraceae bacterium]MBT5094092.1 hypothetical protein [Halobacteriovoraceae bacterium]